MDDSISGHVLQMVVEMFGYDNIGEIPNDLIIDVYDLAERMDD